jgi:adenine-specific DNA glycosylase
LNTENQSDLIKKQIKEANKHWRLFLSEVPLRQADLSLVTQTPNTNVETSPEIKDAKK